MAKYDSADLTELLCRNVRQRLGKCMTDILVEVEPYIGLMKDSDAAETRVRVLSEIEIACVTFVRKVDEKLKCNSAAAFKVPPALE